MESTATKTPARRTKMMATDKVIPTRATKIPIRRTKTMDTGVRIRRHAQAHRNAARRVETDIRMQNKFALVVVIMCVTPTTLTIGAEYKLLSRLRSLPLMTGFGITMALASGETMVRAARRLTHVL